MTQPSGSQGQQSHANQPLGPGQLANQQAGASPEHQRESEQSLATEQWLRRIPEDSGELLRRKFLIEHMLKKQQEEAK